MELKTVDARILAEIYAMLEGVFERNDLYFLKGLLYQKSFMMVVA